MLLGRTRIIGNIFIFSSIKAKKSIKRCFNDLFRADKNVSEGRTHMNGRGILSYWRLEIIK